MKLNEKIKDLRLKNNLTQKEFAKRIGVSLSSLQKYEYGDFKPSIEIIAKICSYFNLVLEDFLNASDIDKKERELILWDFENLKDLDDLFIDSKRNIELMSEYIDLDDFDKMFLYFLVNLGYNYTFDTQKKELTVFFSTSDLFYLSSSLRYTILEKNEIYTFINLLKESLNLSAISVLLGKSKLQK
jgi:hypothetical protein